MFTYVPSAVLYSNDIGMTSKGLDKLGAEVNVRVGRDAVEDDGERAPVCHRDKVGRKC